MLVHFTRRRRDLPFMWMFWLFAAFIVGCGTTHLMEVITTYEPVYRLAGLVKALTAAVSLVTAFLLVPLVPKALALRSPRALEQEIQERKRAEEALRQSNKDLELFASVASHDLQEPLRKIQAFGDRLQAKCGDSLGEQGRDYLDRMQTATVRMRTLINDLLTLSRLTTRGQPFVPVDLNQTVVEAVSDLEGRIQLTGGRVEVGPLPTVDGDPSQLRQLLQNLIGNALKFHRPDAPPVVKVEGELLADPRDANCRITVHDNGIGFEEQHAERIFEVFQRLHGRGEYEGAGIGLAICRKVVERHGGAIAAKSAPGQGTTFIVTLPAWRTPGER